MSSVTLLKIFEDNQIQFYFLDGGVKRLRITKIESIVQYMGVLYIPFIFSLMKTLG